MSEHEFEKTTDGALSFSLSREWWWHLNIHGRPIYLLGNDCGTCYAIFKRVGSAKLPLTPRQLSARLEAGLDAISQDVIDTVAVLLPRGKYRVELLTITPSLDVSPQGFPPETVSCEADHYWLCRFEKGEERCDYEIVLPIVKRTKFDPDRIAFYKAKFESGHNPTALALSLVDARVIMGRYCQKALVHFLLDGHHKVMAASQMSRPISVLSFFLLDGYMYTHIHRPMAKKNTYKSPEGQARVWELYDRFQDSLDVQFEDRTVDTRFGDTHVLVTGPAQAPPVVVTHGGNSVNPLGLRGLLPLLKENVYRVYAPDTVGHPGKSAQTRLSPLDYSYGQWLNDVLDGLGLESAAFVGGSFGAGIILRLAAYAPQRISKMALFVPSGIVEVPLSSMMFRIGIPYLLYLLFPIRNQLMRAVRWMGDDLDDDVIEWTEAAFRHVRIESTMPRPATKEELARLTAPTLVIAAEKDAMFPGDVVVARAREILPNLVAAECLAGATHIPSRRDMAYVNERIREFLETDQ